MPSRSKTSTFNIAPRGVRRKKPSATSSGRKVVTGKATPQRSELEASRPAFWQALRDGVEAGYQSLPLPNINPDVVSLASVIVAFLFVVAVSQERGFVAWVFLVVHLFLDGLDGAIARRYRRRASAKERAHGQLVDVLADRASEGILFVIPPFFWPWFPLFLINIPLGLLTLRFRRALILPLRHLFAIIFTLSLIL